MMISPLPLLNPVTLPELPLAVHVKVDPGTLETVLCGEQSRTLLRRSGTVCYCWLRVHCKNYILRCPGRQPDTVG